MLPAATRSIQRLSQRPLQPVTIRQLLARSARVSEEEHRQHAAWIREEMPVRLAHRLADFLNVHYIVVCNSRIHEVFRSFLHAFETLMESKPIEDAASVDEFAKTLEHLVRENANIVQLLQEGVGELQVMLDHVDLDAFLNQTFRTRIGNRVLAEHFLAAHEARVRGVSESTGVVHPNCRPAEMVDKLAHSLAGICSEFYGIEPHVIVEGQTDTEVSFIPDHLTFILQEILKNAFRATIEQHGSSPKGLPPVTVGIMKGSFDVTLKVSDCGGGMQPEQLSQIWRYGYTTTGSRAMSSADQNGILSGLCGQDIMSFRQLAGYGFGLPLSRLYSQYFGGNIYVQSMQGYGTDVYLNVNHLGDVREASAAQQTRLVAS